MAQLTHQQYDALERAIIHRQRVVIVRRGTEYVVVPLALGLREGHEVIETTHPTTGEALVFPLDTVDDVQVIE